MNAIKYYAEMRHCNNSITKGRRDLTRMGKWVWVPLKTFLFKYLGNLICTAKDMTLSMIKVTVTRFCVF